MKKKIFTLFAILLLIFAFSVPCIAAESPSGTVIKPTKPNKNNDNNNNNNGNGGSNNNNSGNKGNDNRNNYGGNTSQTSPKTGYDFAGAFIAIITATGVALVSVKKLSDAE